MWALVVLERYAHTGVFFISESHYQAAPHISVSVRRSVSTSPPLLPARPFRACLSSSWDPRNAIKHIEFRMFSLALF
jgi:hypothetical protein